MKVTTLRLPEPLYEDLVAEAEARDRSFSEYARMLLRNREANTGGEENTQANTSEYAGEYDDRLADLEDRLAEIEAAVSSGGLNQQPPTRPQVVG